MRHPSGATQRSEDWRATRSSVASRSTRSDPPALAQRLSVRGAAGFKHAGARAVEHEAVELVVDPGLLSVVVVTCDPPPKLVWATDDDWQATNESASVYRVCTCWTVAHFRPTIQPPGDPDRRA